MRSRSLTWQPWSSDRRHLCARGTAGANKPGAYIATRWSPTHPRSLCVERVVPGRVQDHSSLRRASVSKPYSYACTYEPRTSSHSLSDARTYVRTSCTSSYVRASPYEPYKLVQALVQACTRLTTSVYELYTPVSLYKCLYARSSYKDTCTSSCRTRTGTTIK